jgi:leucyl aminopeptidase
MAVQIKYLTKKIDKTLPNTIFFSNDKFNVNNLKNNLSNSEFVYINDLLKSSDLKKNLFVFEINSKKKIIIISIKNNLKISDIENLGAELYGRLNYGKNTEYFLNADSVTGNYNNFIGHFLHGLKLKSYEFKKYKSKKDSRIISINVFGKKNKPSIQNQIKFQAVEKGTFYARDLVSEPGNILHPDEYAKRLNSLRKDGLKINIYDKKKLKKLGWHG